MSFNRDTHRLTSNSTFAHHSTDEDFGDDEEMHYHEEMDSLHYSEEIPHPTLHRQHPHSQQQQQRQQQQNHSSQSQSTATAATTRTTSSLYYHDNHNSNIDPASSPSHMHGHTHTSGDIDNDNASTSVSDKVRKRPGRKPNPTSPTVRKEQNRAAQRAFRDRKERHLQQLENMIKDLKDQHFLVTSGYQREARNLKASIEGLQSENYYLREVVFAFEVALSKAGQMALLNDVKEELFRRHHEKHGGGGSVSDTTEVQSNDGTHILTDRDNSTFQLSSSMDSIHTQDTKLSREVLQQIIVSSADSVSSAASSSRQTTPQGPITPSIVPESPATIKSESLHFSPSPGRSLSPGDHRRQSISLGSTATSEPMHNKKPVHPLSVSLQRDGDISNELSNGSSISSSLGNREILYKAPPLFLSLDPDEPVPISPFEPLSSGRKPAYTKPGTVLGKKTDYTKHSSVFDELQSSLFPPGTLTSMHIDMATPQEVVNDSSLFSSHAGSPTNDQEDEDIEVKHMEETMGSRRFSGSPSSQQSTSGLDSGYGYPTGAGLDTTMMSAPVHSATTASASPSSADFTLLRGITPEIIARYPPGFLGPHRLQKEIQTLALLPPATDPDIDPKIYELPHDPRIDIMPCPKMRAQLILHQNRYDPDELFRLFVNKAISHGPPTNRSTWELPAEFFDKYGYLAGPERDRLRNKKFPKKEIV
ncbi:hypothetical protein BG004_000380 [Podila humilis]|nr:hypothetical protein BG004_000380 [Podila humilis]